MIHKPPLKRNLKPIFSFVLTGIFCGFLCFAYTATPAYASATQTETPDTSPLPTELPTAAPISPSPTTEPTQTPAASAVPTTAPTAPQPTDTVISPIVSPCPTPEAFPMQTETTTLISDTPTEEPTSPTATPLQPTPTVPAQKSHIYPATEPDTPFLVVQKTFVDIEPDQIPNAFSITLAAKDGTSHTLQPDNALSKSPLCWQWTVYGAASQYNVSESYDEPDLYSIDSSGTGDISITSANLQPKELSSVVSCNTPLLIQDGKFLAACPAGASDGIVLTEKPLSLSQQLAITAYLANHAPFSENLKFYSIPPQAGQNGGFSIAGNAMEYNSETHEITLDSSGSWSSTLYAEFDTSCPPAPEINIVSTRPKWRTDLLISQTISGNMSDPNKIFYYEAKIRRRNDSAWVQLPDTTTNDYSIRNNVINFQLTHGESVRIFYVPSEATLYVRQLNTGQYSVTAENRSGTTYKPQSSGWFVIPIESFPHITFNNCKEAVPDTGILLDTAPYLLILFLIMIGSSAWFLHKYHDFSHNE